MIFTTHMDQKKNAFCRTEMSPILHIIILYNVPCVDPYRCAGPPIGQQNHCAKECTIYETENIWYIHTETFNRVKDMPHIISQNVCLCVCEEFCRISTEYEHQKQNLVMWWFDISLEYLVLPCSSSTEWMEYPPHHHHCIRVLNPCTNPYATLLGFVRLCVCVGVSSND